MFVLGTILLFVVWYVGYNVQSHKKHRHQMHERFEHRIHVNGIRGKSSVTRLIAAVLREGDIKTAAKTTGTAARVLVDHRTDTPIPRKEADIAEQRKILNYYMGDMHRMYTGEDYKAVVFECMAINPLYQKYLEDKVMYSTIGVITNVREDHTDMLGETLPEIARSLCATVPRNGHLITAETNEELLDIMQSVCKERGTQLHKVGKMRVGERHMAKFKHFEYKANVAVALKVAQLVGIDRQTALAGMHRALPDPGAFTLKQLKRRQKTLHWANLFAVNDRESFVLTVQSLASKVGGKAKKAIILNNRNDRPERVAQFVDIAAHDIEADYIFTFGDYERQVKLELEKRAKAESVKVVHLGNSTDYKTAEGEVLFDKIAETVEYKDCLLFGAVNIHTPQAQALLQAVEGEGNAAH